MRVAVGIWTPGRIALGLTSVIALSMPVTRAARTEVPAAADAYGYTATQCAFDWIDIASSGVPVTWTASGPQPAADDGGAVIPLSGPFELYGEATSDLVISTNGYLALAVSLDQEDGGDFSNDGGLPAIPGNAIGVPARILVHHDDHSGFDSGGSASTEYFASCPRASEALGDEACTVLQWTDWGVPGGGDTADLQAVVYHESFLVVLQLRPGAGGLEGGTIGIQNGSANIASQYRPLGPPVVDTAVCFFEPRFPSGGLVADLQISKVDKVDVDVPEGSVGYSIGILNHGPSPAIGAQVADPVPLSLTNCAWSCTASSGSCTPSGVGDVLDLIDLEPGGWADYVLVCEFDPASSTIANTATVTPPAGVTDPQPGNNAATDLFVPYAGRAPDLTLSRSGSELQLNWGSSCLETDADYEVYEGTLGDFESHTPVTCSTGGSTDRIVALPAGNAYYLVVPNNLTFEGSYGRASNGTERAAAANACLTQSVATPCPSPAMSRGSPPPRISP